MIDSRLELTVLGLCDGLWDLLGDGLWLVDSLGLGNGHLALVDAWVGGLVGLASGGGVADWSWVSSTSTGKGSNASGEQSNENGAELHYVC